MMSPAGVVPTQTAPPLVSPERRRFANCSIDVKSGAAEPLEAGANQMQRRV